MMRNLRGVLTKRALRRFKWMSGVFCVLCSLIFVGTSAETYIFQEKEFDYKDLLELDKGYITEYTNKEEFCTSFVTWRGMSLMNEKLQAVIYLLVLFYLFLGIAIVADIFMGSIEVITAGTSTVPYRDSETGETIFVQTLVWNPTIANLTLMALGSSAPEILLSVIETVQMLGSLPGELGPSTIVGSAAFNLLCISAVSIMSVGPTVKKVDDMGVFMVTCAFALFAYIWLYIVLMLWTPGFITMAEAVLTLAFFFILVGIAFMADKINSKRKDAMKSD